MAGKIKEQQQAQYMRSQGKSVKEIARLLRVSSSSTSIWVRSVKLSAQQKAALKGREIKGGEKGRSIIQKRCQEYYSLHPKIEKGPRWPKRSVENFFDTWTPEMAYVLGYFAADGWMSKNAHGSCYVGFASTDKELIETTKKLMACTNVIEVYQRPMKNRKVRYTLQIGSKKLFNRLLELGLTPRKSLTIRFPAVPEALLGHFVRGYLDGDGNISLRIPPRRKSYIKSIFLVRFTSGSYRFLNEMQKRLSKTWNISKRTIFINSRKSNHHMLSYSGGDARQMYRFMYPTSTVPCLKRKKDAFEKGLYHWSRRLLV